MQTEHIESETLAAYALGALEPAEFIIAGAHIATCEVCQREVASFRSVGDALPQALPIAEPPPDLRDRILARVQATPQGGTASAPRLPVTPAAPPVPRVAWWRRLMPFAVALALVAGVLFGRYWPTPSPSLAEQPGTRTVAMTGEGTGTGVFAVAAGSNQAELQVTGLPPLPAGQVYQLWLLQDGTPISVGTFTVDADGRGTLQFNGLSWSSGYNTVAITAEQQGGSPAPTSSILLAGGF